MAISLTDVLSSAMTQQGQANNATANQAEQAMAANEQMTKLADEAAKAKAQVAQEQQQIITNLSTAIGGNPAAANYKEVEWANTFREETDAAIAKSKQVQQLEATSFFDNPIGWFGDQLKADAVNQEIEQHKSTANIASESLSKLHALETSGAKSAIETNATLTKAGESAALFIQSSQDQLNALKLKSEVASSNINLIDAMSQGNQRALSIAKTQYDVTVTEENRARAREEFSMKRQLFDYQLQEAKIDIANKTEDQQFQRNVEARNEIKFNLDKRKKELDITKAELSTQRAQVVKEKDENKKKILEQTIALNEQKLTKNQAELDTMQSNYDAKTQKLLAQAENAKLSADAKIQKAGIVMQEQESKSQTALALAEGLAATGQLAQARYVRETIAPKPEFLDEFIKNNFPTADDKRLAALIIKNGETKLGRLGAEATLLGKVYAGDNPYESILNLDNPMFADISNLPKDTQDTINVIRDISNTVQAEKDFFKLDQKDQINKRNAVINSRVQEWVNNAEIKGSAMAAPPLAAMMNVKQVTDTALWQKVLFPIAATGGSKSDYNTIAQKAADAVKQGHITADEAIAGVNTFFDSVIHYNNAHSGFSLLALPYQNSYNVVSKSEIGGLGYLGSKLGLGPYAESNTNVKFGAVSGQHTRTLTVNAADRASVTTDILLRLGQNPGAANGR